MNKILNLLTARNLMFLIGLFTLLSKTVETFMEGWENIKPDPDKENIKQIANKGRVPNKAD